MVYTKKLKTGHKIVVTDNRFAYYRKLGYSHYIICKKLGINPYSLVNLVKK